MEHASDHTGMEIAGGGGILVSSGCGGFVVDVVEEEVVGFVTFNDIALEVVVDSNSNSNDKIK